MDRFDDDTLFAELRELRPTPRPEFTAELDERAAAGFPRGTSTSAAAKPFARIVEKWRSLSVTRRLVPVLGFALVAVVVATAVIASTGGKSGSSLDVMTSATSGGAAESSGAAVGAAPKLNRENFAEEAEESAGAESAIEAEPEVEGGKFSGAIPVVPGVAGSPSRKAEKGPAATTGQRDIERSAYVVLGTKPGQVSAAAAKVYTAVHAADGIVLHSSVQSGKAGATGATFDLLIPSRKLDDALAAFSSIAEVRSRHDATNDITAPTVGAAEELADSNASIDSLLKQLGDAETESEQESVEARLREERRRHAGIRASLDRLHERASLSEVSVRIVTGNGAGVAPPSKGSDGGGWGVGDALHDAGHILTVAAGVLLIALAILGPIALIAIFLWGGNRFRVRRLRERTLG